MEEQSICAQTERVTRVFSCDQINLPLTLKQKRIGFTRCLFISIKVNILKVSVDFYAIKIVVTCGRNFGYLLLLCHKPLETIVLNPEFYEPIPVFILASILKYFLRIKFMKNWREIIVRSYQNKTSWEPVICKSNSLFGFLFTHRATASTGNVQYSDLFWNK